MDQLYFSSISTLLGEFFMIRGETLSALQTLSHVTKSLDEHAPERYEFGLYMGVSQLGNTKKVSINLNVSLVNKSKETFQSLLNRTEQILSRLNFTIVPSALSELNDMFKELVNLHLDGYRTALELLETRDLSLMPRLTNTFQECSSMLLVFEKLQRSKQASS